MFILLHAATWQDFFLFSKKFQARQTASRTLAIVTLKWQFSSFLHWSEYRNNNCINKRCSLFVFVYLYWQQNVVLKNLYRINHFIIAGFSLVWDEKISETLLYFGIDSKQWINIDRRFVFCIQWIQRQKRNFDTTH